MNVVNKSFGTVLVIGGSGMLGHYTVLDLVQNTRVCSPEEVHVYDRRTLQQSKSTSFYNAQLPGSNYHQGDLCDSARLGAVLAAVKPNVVFDLVSPRMFMHNFDFYIKVNVEARRDLLRLASDVGVRAYIYNSSAGVTHDSYSNFFDADESHPVLFMPEQREPYSHSKAMAETLVLEANGNVSPDGSKFLTAAARLCSPFGNDYNETTNVIVENARAGKQKFQVGDGRNMCDWTYVENGVRAYLLIAQALLAAQDKAPSILERVDSKAFLITNGEHVPFWHFTRGLGAAAGFATDPKDITVIPRPVAMAMAFLSECITWIFSLGRRKATFTRYGVRYGTINRTHNIDKARKRLRYEPFVNLDEAMVRATASWRDKRDKQRKP